MRAKDALGLRGEAAAAHYLEQQGLRVIDQNWRCAAGEIDIVALDGDILVVIEVKTRSSLRYGHPFEAISAAKLARLYRLAGAWSRYHDLRCPRRRIDAVAVMDDGVGPVRVEHLRAVG